MPSPDDAPFVAVQVKEAIETYRSQFSLLIQILTVFVVANVTIIGYAVSNQIAGMAIVGALIPFMMIFVIYGAGKFMLPVIFTAVSLEYKYAQNNESWLISTLFSSVASPEFIKHLQEISQIKNHEERIKTLRKQRLRKVDRIGFRFILVLISVLQIVTAIVLNLVFGWRFF